MAAVEGVTDIQSVRILLNVEDVRLSLAFYRDKLGFGVDYLYPSPEAPTFAMITHGAARLMLNSPEEADSRHRRLRPSYGETVVYCYVPDAHAVHRALTERGTPVGPVVAEDYGMNEFLVRDPDGYEIAFASESRADTKPEE